MFWTLGFLGVGVGAFLINVGNDSNYAFFKGMGVGFILAGLGCLCYSFGYRLGYVFG